MLKSIIHPNEAEYILVPSVSSSFSGIPPLYRNSYVQRQSLWFPSGNQDEERTVLNAYTSGLTLIFQPPAMVELTVTLWRSKRAHIRQYVCASVLS